MGENVGMAFFPNLSMGEVSMGIFFSFVFFVIGWGNNGMGGPFFVLKCFWECGENEGEGHMCHYHIGHPQAITWPYFFLFFLECFETLAPSRYLHV